MSEIRTYEFALAGWLTIAGVTRIMGDCYRLRRVTRCIRNRRRP